MNKKRTGKNKYSPVFAHGYPPKYHMLRDLQVSAELHGSGSSMITAPVVPEVCDDQGAMRVGIMATLVDTLSGALAIRAVQPDWAATADLTIHTTGRVTSGFVSVVSSLMRSGSTMVVFDLDIRKGSRNATEKRVSIGSAVIAFSRLLRREDTRELWVDEDSTDVHQYNIQGSGLSRPYLHELGVRVLDKAAGVVELNMKDYVRNSFGALQGGAVAILADVAGEQAARAATGKPMITCDLGIHYISPGKTGPFRTNTRVIRRIDNTVLTRIEVIDMGSSDRIIGLAMNTAVLHHGS